MAADDDDNNDDGNDYSIQRKGNVFRTFHSLRRGYIFLFLSLEQFSRPKSNDSSSRR